MGSAHESEKAHAQTFQVPITARLECMKTLPMLGSMLVEV